uniref:RING-type domain-containing protein n=1 Tax=Euplotes harpa TaxID=151035 RepID=A0A7S3JI02_9SPIT|mmetsp:Transcript_4166/g.5086  ORF Transcript_4166/g.5086 Transcript_4166/m.5086 type:complete len:319 (+) Transcript_4166:3-959(+)
MERFQPRSGQYTKSDLARWRQQEIDAAWGGQSLEQAINSSPIKRSIPSNLQPSPLRAKPLVSKPTKMASKHIVSPQIDRMSLPVQAYDRLTDDFYFMRELDSIDEELEYYNNMLNTRMRRGMNADLEEDKDEVYWNEMYNAYNRNHANARVAAPRRSSLRSRASSSAAEPESDYVVTQANRATRIRPLRVPHPAVSRPMDIWERAQANLNRNGPNNNDLSEFISREITALYNEMSGATADNKKKAKEDIMKKLKTIKIATKKQFEKDDTCSICLCNYAIGHKVVKLSCTHMFHVKCVKQWFDKKQTCPKCRKDLSKAK